MADPNPTATLTDGFTDSHGGAEGFVVPDYNVLNVPIILQSTDKGYLVHEVVTDLTSPTTWFNGKSGTGEMGNDAVNYYTKDEFVAEYGDDFVTRAQYERDAAGLQDAHLSVGSGTPVVEASDFMKMRIEEIDVDLGLYEAHLQEQIQASPEVLGGLTN